MLFFNENILFEVIASFQQGWKSLEDGLFFFERRMPSLDSLLYVTKF